MGRIFTPGVIAGIYQRRAKNYEKMTRIYDWFGAPLEKWRARAIERLDISPGAKVVDIGCGTGLNFPLFAERIGPTGKIIGVDLTPGMLEQARRRVEKEGWQNVELVQSPAIDFTFPPEVDVIFSSYALTLVPEYDEVIRRGTEALKTGGRWGVLDFKLSTLWKNRLIAPPLAFFMVRPYAGTLEMARRRQPWKVMESCLQIRHFEEFYMGFVYIAIGEKR